MSPAAPRRAWWSAIAWGTWLSVAAVWPARAIPIGLTAVWWQPLLLTSVLVAGLWRWRRDGWRVAVSQGLVWYALFSVAAWLPTLRTTSYWTEYPYPRAYAGYLFLYEAGFAALLGYAAMRAARPRDGTWWARGGWSRPAVVAPVLLVLRGVQFGHWVSLVAGLVIGILAAMLPVDRRIGRWLVARARWAPLGIALLAALLVYGSAMRIYTQTGAEFPAASDDGPDYYEKAIHMAAAPRLFFTDQLRDRSSFTGYYPLMALWFRLVGRPDIPSWLLWHAVAGALLGVCVFWLGRRLIGPWGGAVVAVLAVADRIVLHLLSTMNMETFFIPALYLALCLWVAVGERPSQQRWWWSALAGFALGVATIFRPTALLLPLALAIVLVWERSGEMMQRRWAQCAAFVGGLALPVALMVVRNRIAWGIWSLSGTKAMLAAHNNEALRVQGQHLVDVGFGRWLQLLLNDPSVLWTHMLPTWWRQWLFLWTHPGFGQMDLLYGLNHQGPHQAVLTTLFLGAATLGGVLAVRRRTRCGLVLATLPVYFSALVLVFFVLNSRYRTPYIPALYLLAGAGCAAVIRWLREQESDDAARTPARASLMPEVIRPEVLSR